MFSIFANFWSLTLKVSPEGTSTRSKKDLIDILRKALEERRPVIADSDDDDVESDNEAWNWNDD